MAEHVTITRLDDIDESVDAETVHFAYKGANYEIDLAEKNAAKLDEAIAPFIEKARKVSRPAKAGRSAGKSTSKRSAAKEELAAAREWGRGNGFKVNDRGRISAEVMDGYRASLKGVSVKKADKAAAKPESKKDEKAEKSA